MILTLMGAPGSGKGTQGRRLASALDVPYLASGDLIRRAMAQHSTWGEAVRSFFDRGMYVPDEVIVPTFVDALSETVAIGNAGAVIDGFPRTTAQAIALDEVATAHGDAWRVSALVLQVPSEVLIGRMSGRWVCGACNASYNVQSHPPLMVGVCDGCGHALVQRVDDRRDTIQYRLAVYQESTQPVIAYYQDRNVAMHVNGEGPESDVGRALLIAARLAIRS